MENISVSDVQKYCESCSDGLLVHGTVSSLVDDIIKEGLLVRAKDFPTVLESNGGLLKDGTQITEYTWYEPRAEGESVALIIKVPISIIKDIHKKGLPLTQDNIFDVICEDIELEVPNNEETRSAYKTKKVNNNNTISGLQKLDGVLGPKFSEFGAKPGTKYKHIGIPPKYICAITSSNKVYYASEEVQDFIEKQKNIKKPTSNANQTQPLTLYDTDELF